MIALDTNMIVRFLVRDHERQYKIVEKYFLENEICVQPTVLLEAEWVLRAVMNIPKAKVMAAFEGLMEMRNVEVADSQAVSRAIEWAKQGLDFADALHLATCGASESFVSFDRNFARKAARIRSEPVVVVAH